MRERERERGFFVFVGGEKGEGLELIYGRNYGSNLPTQAWLLAEDCHVKSHIIFLDYLQFTHLKFRVILIFFSLKFM